MQELLAERRHERRFGRANPPSNAVVAPVVVVTGPQENNPPPVNTGSDPIPEALSVVESDSTPSNTQNLAVVSKPQNPPQEEGSTGPSRTQDTKRRRSPRRRGEEYRAKLMEMVNEERVTPTPPSDPENKTVARVMRES